MPDVTAARLYEARAFLGFTLEEAAGALRWSEGMLISMEAGTVVPSETELAALGKVYGRPVAWLRGAVREVPDAAT